MCAMIPGEHLVAEGMASRPVPVERVLLGTADPSEVVALVRAHCVAALGADVARYEFHAASVGAVHGVVLADGRRAVVKLHRVATGLAYLRALDALKLHVADHGLAAPRPLHEPVELRSCWVTTEELLDTGRVPEPFDAADRELMARELEALVRAASGFRDRAALTSSFAPPAGSTWPTPHDIRFDFAGTSKGAEWIDCIGELALAQQRAGGGQDVVGHHDWRREHLRVDAGRVIAIYDWDSVRLSAEPVLVAGAMRTFTCDWSEPERRQYPTLDEMFGFLADYEAARGAAFSEAERVTMRGALVYGAAYTARCEHSDRSTSMARAAPQPVPAAAPEGSMAAFLVRHVRDLLDADDISYRQLPAITPA